MENNFLLRVNLTTGSVEKESIPKELIKNFLGGSGLASKYLYDEVPPAVEPYSPENKVIFAVGPFQGYPVPGGAKWSVVSKSPLTKTFAVTTAGAEWGVHFGKTGYQLLIIEGKAEKPVYLYIGDEKASLEDGSNLWGKDALKTADKIRDNHSDKNLSVASIGPAGEKGVGIACIVADKHSFAGRCGIGAVLGSKNLKAIAVKGNREMEYHDEEGFKKLNKELFLMLSDSAKEGYRPHGTALDLMGCEQVGDLPIKYWTEAEWPEGAEKIGAPNFTKEVNAKPWPCKFCPVGCHHHVDFEYEGERIIGAGAEYESLGMLGSNCLVDDVKAVSKANELCNRLGIDTISAGSFVGFTMEAFEKGLISETDLGGRAANWGDGKFLLEMVMEIGNKEGFGARFSRGIKPAAEEIGKEALDLIVEVKNLDFPAHDPRSYFSLAINYATGTRGACHLRGYSHVGEGGAMLLPEMGHDQVPERFSMEKKAWIAKTYQDLAALHDSLVICIFIPIHGMNLTEVAKILNLIKGTDYSPKDLMEIGERIVNLQRQINIKDGISKKDDVLPKKMFQPSRSGFRKNQVPEPFNETLEEYYKLRGWDSEGVPLPETLAKWGL